MCEEVTLGETDAAEPCKMAAHQHDTPVLSSFSVIPQKQKKREPHLRGYVKGPSKPIDLGEKDEDGNLKKVYKRLKKPTKPAIEECELLEVEQEHHSHISHDLQHSFGARGRRVGRGGGMPLILPDHFFWPVASRARVGCIDVLVVISLLEATRIPCAAAWEQRAMRLGSAWLLVDSLNQFSIRSLTPSNPCNLEWKKQKPWHQSRL
ncbi:hypothetical protein BDZ85DRAFT_255506 [Elsinoe ampelina]|uniref:Uncharacterized protein n=1 Tax=Elsinoe ampelina TaxID=302913 RepID=A0A6A6GR38_9PEZI|nr:hypothetical protein BDZ85DRAFT_255506 [Elsinoe ampelina]